MNEKTMDLTLLVGIVPHNRGDAFMDAAKKAGAGGGTVIMARGQTEYRLLNLLALGDVVKEFVYILVTEAEKKRVSDALIAATANEKPRFGVLFTLAVTQFIKTGTLQISGKDEDMMETLRGGTPYQLITVILNKGFADDAMEAARKAGAAGGTIIYAHGTGKEEDVKFFGVTLVPEKEMLVILTPRETAAPIVEAIRTLPCLAQPASGIAYCQDVASFTVLGKPPGSGSP
ncbi:MAG: transcriptional regulator [Spirochaetaceae bacterium]|jgi:nitrogen regulatory protein PII|nr:transcriptional regulator [Spirochaetaceae bacterium]